MNITMRTRRLFIAASVLLTPLLLSAQVTAADDYAHTTINASSVRIKPLSNDSTMTGFLKLDKIVLSNNGTATLSADRTEIIFSPNHDFKGIASVNYTVTDGLGHFDCGLVTIHVWESPMPETQTIKLFARPGESLTFTAPVGAADPSALGSTGSVNWDTQKGLLTYKPNTVGYANLTTFDFFKTENGTSKEYIVDIVTVDKPAPILLKDDYVSILMNSSKTIDAYANDTRTKPIRAVRLVSAPSSNYSVSSMGDGRFLIVPASNFKGTFTFDYEVSYFDNTTETATIHAAVANYEPNADQFEITAYRGVPYEFSYNIPLDKNSWSFIPKNNGATRANGKVSLNTKNEMIYTPPTEGETDEFDVQYCVSGNSNCKTIKIKVNLQPATPQVSSLDCVFPGDANRDGIVDMWDLLSVGNNIGQYGTARTNHDGSWLPTAASNWAKTLDNGVNIKNADLNGDGVISAADTAIISANYGKINSVVAETVPEPSKIELQLLRTSNPLAEGDMLEITVVIGSANQPVIDTRGLTFSVGYDADMIQENTLTVDFEQSTWLSRYNAFLAMSKLVNRGRIEAGLARSENRGVSGQGAVSSIKAIVADDVTGFHTGDKPSVRIRVNDVYLMDAQGRKVQVEGKELVIPISKVQKDEPLHEGDLLMFPNPSSDFVSFYLNGYNTISSLRIVDMMGKEIRHQANIQGKQATIYFDDFAPGMYIAEVMTEKGRVTKKIQVVK